MPHGSRDALLAWMRQFGLLMLLYIGTTALCAWASANLEAPNALRTVLILTPILPGLGLIGFTVRAYRLCDEGIRRRMLQAAAMAAVVVAVFAMVYFFLELLGMPRLSMAWISNIIWAVFVAQMIVLIRTGR
ncbi:MAG TPA: hypothetical protein VIX87_00080 [Steroidobacteraceae bacterium]